MNNRFNKLQNGTNRAVYSPPFSLQYLRDLKLILPRKVKKQIATITDGFISQARVGTNLKVRGHDCCGPIPLPPPNHESLNTQSNLVTEGVIESVRIRPVEFRENVGAFFPPGTKQTVRNNELSVLSDCP